jgi:hypothetical protein
METKTVERMAESFSEPTMQERFENFAERVISSEKKEEKEDRSGPREISLKGRPEEEREWIEKVAQKDDSAKESRRESSAEKEATVRTEQRPDAKAGEKSAARESDDSRAEPIAADRYFQRKFEGKEEHENHWRQVNARAGIALAYVNQHPEKAQIEQGLRGLIVDRPQGFQMDLYTALAEVASPGEVLRHIALQPQDREVLRQCKNPQELRAAVQTIAKRYPAAAASRTSPKPKAPRPPSEVGGRSAATDDGTRGEMDFGSFEKNMNARYARHGR